MASAKWDKKKDRAQMCNEVYRYRPISCDAWKYLTQV